MSGRVHVVLPRATTKATAKAIEVAVDDLPVLLAALREAGIEVGFGKRSTPLDRVKKLLPKLTPTEKRKLKEMLE
jgi:hypothetical protein